jgi:aquaporin Z
MEVLKYFVEFLGTFLFLSVILASGSPVLIALSLLAVILLGGSISGGHFNPAVSIMMWANGAISMRDMAIYAVSQVAGGLAALGIYKAFLITRVNNIAF